MQFGIIYYGTEAKNRGIDQLCQSLSFLGHKPLVVTRRPKNNKKITEFNGTPVIQVPPFQHHSNTLLSAPVPFNPLWEKWIFNLAKQHGLDGLFIRETPLAWSGIKAGKRLRIPVFLDIRENLGATYESNKKQASGLKRIRKRWQVQLYEKFVLPKFHHIFTSTDELRSWLRRDYEINSSIMSTLGNYPSKLFFEQAEKALLKKQKEKNNIFRLVHAGYVLENRGLQDIINALVLIKKQTSSIILRIIGNGPYLKHLKSLVFKLDLERHVEFVPMLPPGKVADALTDCDVGICSYFLNEQTHQTLPGKLFEYMAMGLPVLSSARAPVVRIIEKHKCGVVYNSRNPEHLKKIIIDMFRDKETLNAMGDRGKEAVKKFYNWQSTLKILEQQINSFKKI